jgi:hypothetical protein
MRWVGHVAHMGEGRNVYRVLVGKPGRRRLLERPRCRCEDGIIVDLREIGWGGVEWIHMAQDRDHWWDVGNAVMNLRVLTPWSYSGFGYLKILHSVSLLLETNME